MIYLDLTSLFYGFLLYMLPYWVCPFSNSPIPYPLPPSSLHFSLPFLPSLICLGFVHHIYSSNYLLSVKKYTKIYECGVNQYLQSVLNNPINPNMLYSLLLLLFAFLHFTYHSNYILYWDKMEFYIFFFL